MDSPFVLAAALAVFLIVFVRIEFGLYLVIFSMLLSPQLGSGGAVAEGRRIVIRSEDLLLLVVAFSWLAKTAVNKELGLTLKTPLNRPILAYVAATAIATLIGYMTGTVAGFGGAFYVLKYIEYFIVYYMVVNNLIDRRQAWRLVTAAFLTAVIVSLIGLTQIPTGQRVSAPFEGKEGEPNTAAAVASPAVMVLLPDSVTKRVLYTFEPERGQPTVRVGAVGLDPSTSARLISVKQAFEGFTHRPIFGYGVTGFAFMDQQFARTLVETGVVGLATFLALVWALLKAGMVSFRTLTVPEDRGLALGFVAGTVGLLGHALGANTFIIVRIMEPFWFFAAIVVALPGLAQAETAAAPAPVARLSRRVA